MKKKKLLGGEAIHDLTWEEGANFFFSTDFLFYEEIFYIEARATKGIYHRIARPHVHTKNKEKRESILGLDKCEAVIWQEERMDWIDTRGAMGWDVCMPEAFMENLDYDERRRTT